MTTLQFVIVVSLMLLVAFLVRLAVVKHYEKHPQPPEDQYADDSWDAWHSHPEGVGDTDQHLVRKLQGYYEESAPVPEAAWKELRLPDLHVKFSRPVASTGTVAASAWLTYDIGDADQTVVFYAKYRRHPSEFSDINIPDFLRKDYQKKNEDGKEFK